MSTDRIDELLSETESRVETLLEREEVDESDLVETLEDLLDVADEAEDLLETIDLRGLAGALDLEDLPEVADLEDLPEAIEERDPEKAVHLRKLLRLADLPQLLDSADVRALWSEKRELEEEVDDLADGAEEPDEGDDGDLLDVDVPDDVDLGDELVDEGLGGEGGELAEAALQKKIDDAVAEFRETLIDAHRRLGRLREENEARTRSQDDQPSSSNPTAFSSLPVDRGDVGNVGTHSTVPGSVRHSDAPSRERIYGDRFGRWTDDG